MAAYLAMKKALVFSTTFFIVAFVDMALFGTVGLQIPLEKTSWILDNTILSIILFFWMFIGIPALFSYGVTFILMKGNFSNKQKLHPLEITNNLEEYDSYYIYQEESGQRLDILKSVY